MDDQKPRIIETSDGSHSLYQPNLKETYHSSHGALTESQHVFIQAGLEYYNKKTLPERIHIFEVGFGTGLNALLAYQWSINNAFVNFTSIENNPVESSVSQNLNYGKLCNQDDIFNEIHNSRWNKTTQISEKFTLHKIKNSWYDYPLKEEHYHVIFYDAFAHGKQPEMWNMDLLLKCHRGMTNGGVLTTYSARGQLKRDLKEIGFTVETLPGSPGKKEMVRAIKD